MSAAGRAATEVAVIGAGVSGCAAAIALRQAGIEVALLDRLPRGSSRFCGEFLSGEALSVLRGLGVADEVMKRRPGRVERMRLSAAAGTEFSMPLPVAGLGLSRATLDALLAAHAEAAGAEARFQTAVDSIEGNPAGGFRLQLRRAGAGRSVTLHARAVIGAFGKRSNLDGRLRRPFLRRSSRYVGVRRQFRDVAADNTVSLYLFEGGYCGLTEVDEGLTNVCMLATRRALRRCGGSPEKLIERAAADNMALGERLRAASPAGRPQTIAAIPFGPKEPLVEGIFLAGDGAGVMAPFLGVGIAAGLRSGAHCAECVSGWLRKHESFSAAAGAYRRWWFAHLGGTRRWGRLASALLCHPRLGTPTVALLRAFPELGARIYRQSRPR